MLKMAFAVCLFVSLYSYSNKWKHWLISLASFFFENRKRIRGSTVCMVFCWEGISLTPFSLLLERCKWQHHFSDCWKLKQEKLLVARNSKTISLCVQCIEFIMTQFRLAATKWRSNTVFGNDIQLHVTSQKVAQSTELWWDERGRELKFSRIATQKSFSWKWKICWKCLLLRELHRNYFRLINFGFFKNENDISKHKFFNHWKHGLISINLGPRKKRMSTEKNYGLILWYFGVNRIKFSKDHETVFEWLLKRVKERKKAH